MKGVNKYLFLLLGIFTVGKEAIEKRLVPAPAVQEVINEEAYVNGEELVNVAMEGRATQSSTFPTWDAEKAIDGIKNDWTKCSSTDYALSPFWRLDLMKIYRVERVVVTNRIDCCVDDINGAEIHIGNSLDNNGNNNPICAVIPGIPAAQSVSYSCYGMVGQYVNVIVPGRQKVLTLCEVEVYGMEFQLSRAFLKIELESGANLSDPETRDRLLEQLESALQIQDVSLNWIQSPVEIINEEEGQDQCP